MSAVDVRDLGRDLLAQIAFTVCWVPDLEPLCWTWSGAVQDRGYGYYSDRATTVHKLAYMILRGPVGEGLTLDHLCRNKLCCNPAHLEPVTNAENIRRGAEARKRSAFTNLDDERNEYELYQDRAAAKVMEGIFRCGEVGPNRRRIEVVPETPPVRRPAPSPTPAPVPAREPEEVPA
ncbi:HNH endonuclease signature motif containing protein [Mycobacterium kansasii]